MIQNLQLFKLFLSTITLLFALGGSHQLNAQNTPCSATTLATNMVSAQTFNMLGLSNSGVDNPICGGNVSSDIWFQVTVPSSGFINISTFAGSMSNAGIAVYEGPCNDLTETACINDNTCQNTSMPGIHFYTYPPGTTLYVRIWPETGGAGTFDILVQDDEGSTSNPVNLSTVGTANMISDNCVQLTSNSNSQSGCAWDPNQFDFTQPIDFEITMNFGTNNGGADGICLIFQNDPNGLSTCGTLGGGLGASGIQNSFIVEFDTWDNGAGVSDISNDHASIFTNGNINNATPPVDGPVDLGNIEDGNDYDVRFTWNPATNGYEVYFNGTLIMSGTFDIVANCFGGQTSVWGGFSASTGGATNVQTVCYPPSDSYPTPTGAITEEEICEGDGVFVGGGFQTTTGVYSDVFNSNGCDSIVYTDLTVNPTTFATMSATVCNNDCFEFNGSLYCSPGQHTATLTNAAGCDSVVTINLNMVAPIAVILQPDAINCNTSVVTLDGSLSSSGAGISYQWTAPSNSCIIGNSNSSTIAVSCEGEYSLTVFYDDGTIACSETTTITVVGNTELPTIQIAQPTDLSCAQTCTDLITGGSSSGNGFVYDWIGPNNFTSNAEQPVVCAPGTYFLTITNFTNGCVATSSIDVGTDDATPVADAGIDAALNCNTTNITLDGSNSSTGADFELTWSDINGNFISNMTTLDVNSEGEYILTVASLTNDCISSDTITVTSDMAAPTAEITGNNQLTCDVTSTTLDGTSSTNGVSFEWQDQAGSPLGSNSTLDVSAPGIYTLIVTNPVNGCDETATFEVMQDIENPVADAGEDQSIDCQTNQIILSAANSTGNGMLAYQWLDSDGNVVSVDENWQATNIGSYQLVVTDLNNNCTDADIVEITSDATFPDANAGVDTLLNCAHPTITLSGDQSDTGDNYIYHWENSAGQTIGQEITLDVDQIGIYSLFVTNTDNGCISSDNILVDEDMIPPFANAGSDIVLDCLSGTAIIDAGNSASGDNISYEWQDGSGNPISDEVSTSINAADTYTIVVTNMDNGCTDSDELIVSLDINSPIADAGPDLTLTCDVDMVNLDGSQSTDGPDITYQWFDENNNSISATEFANANTPGTYSLQVTNVANGCFAISNMVVAIDTISPIATPASFTLNCDNEEALIGDFLAEDNPTWEFEWQDANNTTIGTTDTLTIEDAGVYSLSILDNDNACSSIIDFTVTEDMVAPTADAGNALLLNCDIPTVSLDGSNSSNGPEYEYLWTNDSGEEIGQESNVEVSEAGTYLIVVANTSNGCTSLSTVDVAIDTIAPSIAAANGGTITCEFPSIDLIAQGDSGADFTFQWQNEDGDIVGNGATTPTEILGTYTLTVENTTNGCISTATTTIDEDIAVPTAQAGNDITLNCTMPTSSTIANEGLNNDMLSFEWQNSNDEVIGNDATLPIDAPDLYELIVTNTVNGCTATDIILVQQDEDEPIAALIADNTINCTVASFDLVDDMTSVGNDLTYELWLDNTLISTANAWSATEAGEYTFIVTDEGNGCVDSTSTTISIDQNLPLVAAATNDILTCTQLTALLDGNASDATPALTYQWNTINGGTVTPSTTNPLEATVEQPGVYELVITNTDNNCVSSTEIEVTQDIAIPSADAGADILLNCYQPTDALIANENIDNSIFTFQWLDADGNEISTNQTLPVEAANDYQLVVTNSINGCTASDLVAITQNFDYPTADMIDDDILTCTTTSLSLAGDNISTGSDFSYEWILNSNTISTNSNYTTEDAGDYTLIITNDINGCKDTTNTVIDIDQDYPTIAAATDDILTCDVLIATIDGTASESSTNFTYQWNSIAGGSITPDANNPLLATVQTPGIYELVITDTSNDCISETEVTVDQDIVNPVADAGATFELNCHSPLHVLNGTGSSGNAPISYAWSTGNGQFESPTDISTPTISQPGIYHLEVTNETNGCTDGDDVVITSNFITGLAVEPSQPICYEDLGVLFINQVEGGLPPYIYSIDGGQNFFQQNVFPELEPGQYNIVIQDANACETQTTASIIAPAEPLVEIETSATILQGESYQLNALTNMPPSIIDTILWNPADSLSCTGCLDPIVSPLLTTTYHVTVIDTNQCQASAYMTLYVDQRPLIYVPNAFSPNGDGTNDVIMIFSNHPNVAKVKSFQIYDRWGQNVFYVDNFFPNDELFGWNGVNQNGQPHNSAVFVWWAEVELIDGRVVTYKGDVTLLR